MFLPIKNRIFGYFFQSIEVGAGNISIRLKNGQKVKAQRVPVLENSQLDIYLLAKAIKKCRLGDFLNINEPTPKGDDIEEFLIKSLKFIKMQGYDKIKEVLF